MTEAAPEEQYSFELSLSVLNHLGRNLYRNFVTVLGEAISNSWDADAKNVWIDIDRSNASFTIKDDGDGMTGEDFQNKFLKIGYSKRKDGERRTDRKRPYIGAKGIGKLALLSCADRISIFTKTAGTNYVGGTIDNGDLDQAITNDLTPQEYGLEQLEFGLVDDLTHDHNKGTIIVFQNMKEQMKNSEAYIKKILAMSFKFSLLDEEFTIHVNGSPVTVDDLKDLSSKTEFLWVINDYQDAYTDSLSNLSADARVVTTDIPLKGFLATVEKPRDAKITQTEERASIDLFVNGRLREKNILRHIPTQRVLESYIYGQIHYDSMDREGIDPFTSSREGIVEDDLLFSELLKFLKALINPRLLDEWDALRLARNKEGDDENTGRLSKKQRKTKALISETENEFRLPPAEDGSDEVDDWLRKLRPDAEFNIPAYVDCFYSENLIRNFIDHQAIELAGDPQDEIDKFKDQEKKRLKAANINYEITKQQNELGYLGMKRLSMLAEGGYSEGGKTTPLCQDDIMYTPIRNAVGHTTLLTNNAKNQLRMTLENIKARLKKLLGNVTPNP